MFRKMLKNIFVRYYAYKKSIIVEYANKSIKKTGEGCRPLKNVDVFPSKRLLTGVNKIKIGAFYSITSGVVRSAFTSFLGLFLYSAIMQALSLKYINKEYSLSISISYIKIFFFTLTVFIIIDR